MIRLFFIFLLLTGSLWASKLDATKEIVAHGTKKVLMPRNVRDVSNLQKLLGEWRLFNSANNALTTLNLTQVVYDSQYNLNYVVGSDSAQQKVLCFEDNGEMNGLNYGFLCVAKSEVSASYNVNYQFSLSSNKWEGYYAVGELESALETLQYFKGTSFYATNATVKTTQELKDYLLNRTLTVSGYFSPYNFGNEPFNWAFVTPDKMVYQLQGNAPSSSDVFGWKAANITITSEPAWYMLFLGDWDDDGDLRFDWILVSPQTQALYKLAGVSKSGTFAYSEKIELGYTINSNGSVSFNNTSANVQSNKNMLFALYLTGSDLEENYKAGSVDLEEIVTGYNALSEAQKANIDIVIGFGGAKSAYWQGIKYMDMACLLQDYQDLQFGNDSCYGYALPTLSMGAQDTLNTFLESLKPSEYAKSMLTFWNHGSAYQGVCFDSNKNFDALNLSEITNALSQTQKRFDLIGMDACLMANLEVANAIKESASYFVASEETEPGHGWDYEMIIGYLGQNPNASSIDIGKSIVDSFIDSQKHADTNNKTLSLLDLSKVDATIERFSSLVDSINIKENFKTILDASTESQKYGETSDGTYSVDMQGFVERFENTQSLQNSIDSLVVYNRFEATKKESHGVSIFQPINTTRWQNFYQYNDNLLSYEWYSFLSNFYKIGDNDTIKPTITNEHACTFGGKSGYCMEVRDNLALQRTLGVELLPYGDAIMLFGTFAPEKTNNADEYFMRQSSGNWFWFCSDNSLQQCAFPSAYFIENIDGSDTFYSLVYYNNQTAILFLSLDKTQTVVQHWIVPLNDQLIPSKEQVELKQGDSITFLYYVIDKYGQEELKQGDTIRFTSTPFLGYYNLDAQITYYLQAVDFKGNSVISSIYTTTP